MQDTPLRKVLIVGGGTAGWMTAAFLSQAVGPHIAIELVESEEIGTVGVGESTIPPILTFNRALGLDEDEFVRATQATFKLGLELFNWGAIGERYVHGFGALGRSTGMVDFHHYWLRMFKAGKVDRLDDYAINLLAIEKHKFMRGSDQVPNSPLRDIGYAFQFDANLYARYLRGYAERHGVRRTEGRIVSVQQHPETGFVTSVTFDRGTVVDADLFVDCSGFRGLLIEQTLHAGFEDWRHWLPCDRALAVPSAPAGPLTPFTRVTAHSAGWQWRIPLQHRVGNGHVYCSEFIGDDEATAVLLGHLDGAPLADPRPLRFVAGKRRRMWDRNVVAIGLSGGFIEPLESTSIHLIQRGIARLAALFPDRRFEQADIDEFNRQSALEYEQVRDFIILHYHATRRDDSPFWNHVRTMSIPESLQRKIALFSASGRVHRDEGDLFAETSWIEVMLGQGIMPRGYHPLADAKPEKSVEGLMDDVKRVMHAVVDRMPTHEAFIAQHCAAPAM